MQMMRKTKHFKNVEAVRERERERELQFMETSNSWN